MASPLHTVVSIGGIVCKNRIVMAPLTRMRAAAGTFIPNPLAKEYYSQRAGAGLVIVEATQISQLGQGYPLTPGIYTAEQTAAWKEIVSAVHAKGGKVVMQLWHVGRISHTDHHPADGLPVAPSAIACKGQVFLPTFQQVDYEVPRAMTEEDIRKTVADYVQGAKNSLEAGFDGIEVHSANGYLLDQFLQDGTNKRTDAYGGSVENRMRFLVEVIQAVSTVYPADKVGVRLSPYGLFNDIADSNPEALFTAVCAKMQELRVGYVHVIEPRSTYAGGGDQVFEGAPRSSEVFRKAFGGSFISAGGYTQADAVETVERGHADAIAFGRLYISNPDLAERFATGPNAKLNPYDRSTFYGGGAAGYTDYPAMSLELNYWGGRGLMEPARNLLAIAGKTFVDGRHAAPTGDMAANLGRMPTINTPQGAVGQSSAIYFYTAATANLLGDSTFEAAKCMEIMAHVQEVKTEWSKLVPWGSTPSEETLDIWFDSGAKDTEGPAQGRGTRFLSWWMGRIQAGLTGTNGFAVGSRLSLADVLLYNLFADSLTAAEAPEMSEDKRSPFGSKARSAKALEAFPRIAASVAKVAENANFQTYLAGRGPQAF